MLGITGCGQAAPAASTPHYPATGLVLLSLKDGVQRGAATVGADPVAVIVSADGSIAYVADSSPGDVYAVSLPNVTVAWKQHVGGNPFGLLLHGGSLFVSLFSSAAVVELDPSSGSQLARHPVPDGPAAMAVDLEGRVVVACLAGKAAHMDGSTLSAGKGYGVAVAGGKLWTADYKRAELVPAGDDHAVALQLPVSPFWLAASAGSALLIAAEGASEDSDPGAVLSYDTMSATFKTLARPRDPDQVIQAGSKILAAAHGDHNVLAIEGGRSSAWAPGAPAVALASDPALDLLVVVVNSHE